MEGLLESGPQPGVPVVTTKFPSLGQTDSIQDSSDEKLGWKLA